MRHDGTKRQPGAGGKEKRQLVDVLYQNVGSLRHDSTMGGAAAEQCKAVPAPHPLDTDSIYGGTAGGPLPARADHPHAVASRHQPAKDLEQMNLRSPCVRVGAILPVDEEDVHGTDSKECGPFAKLRASSRCPG